MKEIKAYIRKDKLELVILSWLFGALVAVVYNFGYRPNHENS